MNSGAYSTQKAPREFAFRSNAEERELHHKKTQLIIDAVNAVENDVIAELFLQTAIQAVPEYESKHADVSTQHVFVLSQRLSMTVVAEPDELLQHRNNSFVEARSCTNSNKTSSVLYDNNTDIEFISSKTTTSSNNSSGKLLNLNVVAQSNGQDVAQKSLAAAGGSNKVNPLLKNRSSIIGSGRRSFTTPAVSELLSESADTDDEK